MVYRILLPALILLSCTDGRQTPLDQFRETDASLDSVAVSGKIPLTGTFLTAASLVDSMKRDLRSRDRVGDLPGLSDSLIVHHPNGQRLYDLMMFVYREGVRKASDSVQRKAYERMLDPDREAWLRRYFHRVPSIAAFTVLTKWEGDIRVIGGL